MDYVSTNTKPMFTSNYLHSDASRQNTVSTNLHRVNHYSAVNVKPIKAIDVPLLNPPPLYAPAAGNPSHRVAIFYVSY
jgi:hypothetical protein